MTTSHKTEKKYSNRMGGLRLPPVCIERSDGKDAISTPRVPGAVVTCTVALNLLGLALPLCILQVYDRILPNQAVDTLAFLVLGLIVVIALDAALKMMRTRVLNWSDGRFTMQSSVEAFRRLMNARPHDVESVPSSVHLNRFNSLVSVGDFYGSSSRLLTIDIVSCVLYLAVLYIVGGSIVVVPAVLLLIFATLAYWRNSKLSQLIVSRKDHDNRKYDFVMEVLSGVHTVKSMAMEALMLRRFERLQKQVGLFSYQSMLAASDAQTTGTLYSNLSTIFIVTVGATFAINGDMSIGAVAACTLLSGQLIQPIMRGIAAWAEFQNVRHNFDEALKLFDYPLAPAKTVQGIDFSGDLNLESLSVSDGPRQLLTNVSLKAAPGEIIAIRPKDTNGRVALMQVLCGYQKPTAGCVLIDGEDLYGSKTPRGRQSIAYVGNQPVIFHGTILENLTVFDQSADANTARRVAKLLGLEEEIHLLPNGYDTMLGEGVYHSIPKSMVQSIHIARAIASRPKILILDGATRTLDPNSVSRLTYALRELKKNMLILVMSEYEALLNIADRQFDLADGMLSPQSSSANQSANIHASEHTFIATSDEQSNVINVGPTKSINAPNSANNVHRQLEKLEGTFSINKPSHNAAQMPAAEACLRPLLDALGWQGVERHLYEALPHFDAIDTIDDLRSVLIRLNYMTESVETPLSDLHEDTYPCLYSHDGKLIVVLSRDTEHSVKVFDSEAGSTVSLAVEGIKGTAYILTSIDVATEHQATQRTNWFAAINQRFKQLLTLLFGLGLLTNLLALALPIYVMTVYDKAIGGNSSDALTGLTLGIIFAVGLDLLFRKIRERAQAYYGARLDVLIGNCAFSQLLHLPVGMTESISVGDQVTRLRQLESVRDVFTGPLASALVDLPFTLIFIAAIAFIGGPLAWIPAVLLVVYGGISVVVIPMMRNQVRETGNAKSKLQTLILESVSNQRTIRDISAESVWIDKFQPLMAEFVAGKLKTRSITFNTQTVSQTLMLIAGVSTLGIGSLMVLNGTLSTGALIAVMALSWRVLNPLNQAFVCLNRLGQTLQSIEQINRLMRLPVERVPNLLPSVYRKFTGKLEIRQLILSYPNSKEPIIRGLKASISSGEIVAVTGSSGSGKSTLLKAILGLYPAQGGAVLMDGIDIRQLDTGELRHAISYVPKNFDLFYGSVAQNLRLANPTATDEHVQTIAEDSGLLDPDYEIFLPEGVETRLTNQRIIEMPNDLKQRIILARAFIKPAPFFLFDSPAQDLNAVGKEMFIHKLNQLRGNSTVIMLTQREDLIEQSDRVIGMVNGQIEFDVPVSRYLRVKQNSTSPVPPEKSPRNQTEFRTESAM